MKSDKEKFDDEMDALWGQAVKAAKKLNEADKELFMKRFHAELAQLDASKEKLEQYVKDIKATVEKY
jgi:hypothetical protein